MKVGSAEAGQVQHFAARFSPTETKAFVFDFESSTQANYDSSHVRDRETSVVVRFPDVSFHPATVTLLEGFGTVEGEDVSADVPAQLL